MADVPSKAYPTLERKPGISNWVDKVKGLPDYIERIAKHLHYEQRYEIGRAIASAVNTVKRWAAGGTVREHGGPVVSKETQAKSAAALAEWEAKKGAAHAMNASIPTDDEGFILALCQEIEADLLLGMPQEEPEFNFEAYELALSAERAERGLDPDTGVRYTSPSTSTTGEGLNLMARTSGIINFDWDPNEHPRSILGQFRKVLASAPAGTKVMLPGGDGVEVSQQRSKVKKYTVIAPGLMHETEPGDLEHSTAAEAAHEALDLNSLSDHPGSMGGETPRNFSQVEATGRAGASPDALHEIADAVDSYRPNQDIGKQAYNDAADGEISLPGDWSILPSAPEDPENRKESDGYLIVDPEGNDAGVATSTSEAVQMVHDLKQEYESETGRYQLSPEDIADEVADYSSKEKVETVMDDDMDQAYRNEAYDQLSSDIDPDELEILMLRDGDTADLPDPNEGVEDWKVTRKGDKYEVMPPSGRGYMHDSVAEVFNDEQLWGENGAQLKTFFGTEPGERNKPDNADGDGPDSEGPGDVDATDAMGEPEGTVYVETYPSGHEIGHEVYNADELQQEYGDDLTLQEIIDQQDGFGTEIQPVRPGESYERGDRWPEDDVLGDDEHQIHREVLDAIDADVKRKQGEHDDTYIPTREHMESLSDEELQNMREVTTGPKQKAAEIEHKRRTHPPEQGWKKGDDSGTPDLASDDVLNQLDSEDTAANPHQRLAARNEIYARAHGQKAEDARARPESPAEVSGMISDNFDGADMPVKNLRVHADGSISWDIDHAAAGRAQVGNEDYTMEPLAEGGWHVAMETEDSKGKLVHQEGTAATAQEAIDMAISGDWEDQLNHLSEGE